MIPDTYLVRRIPGSMGRDYLREHHYSHSCHNGPMTWGLFDNERLLGVCAFATPCSENVRASVFGRDAVDNVTELHRLFVEDGTPSNTESWFIKRAIQGLLSERPLIHGILSFADSTEGHKGTIYQASNAMFCGMTGRARFWRDPHGSLRHPRQNGHNVTPDEARSYGWIAEMRDAKLRYLFVVGSPAERKTWRRRVLLRPVPYPKAVA
jgi:hypothetical protein